MAHQSTMLPLGTPAPDFSLPNVDGKDTVCLANFSDAKALLVIFLCAHCPYVIHVREQIAAIARDFFPEGLRVVGITSNDVAEYPEDAPEATDAMAHRAGFIFPVLFDETQSVAKAYTAACTPDFFLFDADKKLTYRGQIDSSRPARGTQRPGLGECDGSDLRKAISATIQALPVSPDQHPSIGCNIKWKPGSEPSYFYY